MDLPEHWSVAMCSWGVPSSSWSCRWSLLGDRWALPRSRQSLWRARQLRPMRIRQWRLVLALWKPKACKSCASAWTLTSYMCRSTHSQHCNNAHPVAHHHDNAHPAAHHHDNAHPAAHHSATPPLGCSPHRSIIVYQDMAFPLYATNRHPKRCKTSTPSRISTQPMLT